MLLRATRPLSQHFFLLVSCSSGLGHLFVPGKISGDSGKEPEHFGVFGLRDGEPNPDEIPDRVSGERHPHSFGDRPGLEPGTELGACCDRGQRTEALQLFRREHQREDSSAHAGRIGRSSLHIPAQ